MAAAAATSLCSTSAECRSLPRFLGMRLEITLHPPDCWLAELRRRRSELELGFLNDYKAHSEAMAMISSEPQQIWCVDASNPCG